jgi:BTB/POZ domain-containing adapter for CUL3-mediated RhoA degradation protein
VKLNVGGALYYTTTQTHTKQDTVFKAMFSSKMEVLTDSEGTVSVRHQWHQNAWLEGSRVSE